VARRSRRKDSGRVGQVDRSSVAHVSDEPAMFTQAHRLGTTQTLGVWCASAAVMPLSATCAIPFGYLAESNRPGRVDTLLPEVPNS
jgi:hypothetical protein